MRTAAAAAAAAAAASSSSCSQYRQPQQQNNGLAREKKMSGKNEEKTAIPSIVQKTRKNKATRKARKTMKFWRNREKIRAYKAL